MHRHEAPSALDLDVVLSELSRLVGHRLAMHAARGVAAVYMVVPADRLTLGLPFWQAYRADTMRPSWPTGTPEAAVTAFAAGAHRWLADAASGLSEVDAELRSRLAAGPQPARQLVSSFQASGVSPDRLSRVARRLGVVRTKAGMRGGWLWSLPEGTEGGTS